MEVQYHRRLELNGRVRNGNGCFLKSIGPPTSRGGSVGSRHDGIRGVVKSRVSDDRWSNWAVGQKFYGQDASLIEGV